jgi:hypothetical protein
MRMPVGASYSPRSPTNSGRAGFGLGPGSSEDDVCATLVLVDVVDAVVDAPVVAPIVALDDDAAQPLNTLADTSDAMSANGVSVCRIDIA